MQTRNDMEYELVTRLMASNNSTLYSAGRITQLIQDAYIWASILHFWPSLQSAKQTSTQANQEYYDYPQSFLTDSIARIYVDGKLYSPKAFYDFRDYVDQATDTALPPDPTNRCFANFGRQFFLYPIPTITGSNNLIVWGNTQAPQLANGTDQTIFSVWDDAGNEAIVQKAFAVAMVRLAPQEAQASLTNAIQLLDVMWQKVVAQLQKSQRLNHPFFDVPDLFAQSTNIATNGNFDVRF